MERKWWTLAAVLGLACWFFGNLYEAVVFSPNWVVDTPAQMARLDAFFVTTGPTLYFVPVTVLTCLVILILWLTDRTAYRRAAVAALALTVLNAVIVAAVVTPLFGDGGDRTLAWTWNVLNVVRMALTATTAVLLFNTFRRLDQAAVQRQLGRM
ncbi:hypothetical protein AB0M54_01065 [Actinoplanes sp. NPDC051470]|uniref:hypothetical protein n=1 Tax=Actinoplanes sp. NPDC051470 TaxID=3157224 RepID=UPI003432E2D7